MDNQTRIGLGVLVVNILIIGSILGYLMGANNALGRLLGEERMASIENGLKGTTEQGAVSESRDECEDAQSMGR
ncbi:MAG: hypothetical protein HYW95_00185 [Candidatus Wildermuthbacteria bacterium]|nr:hypothetical protein [Candidatus Wildermuthbacteria bacterium]